MRLSSCITLAIVLIVSLQCAAKPAAAPLRGTSLSPGEVAAFHQQELRQQNLLLKQQAVLLEDSHESILTTTYWALGGVFTMAFLLAGFSWLNNNKLYSADKERLREELEAKISKAVADLQLSEQDQRGKFLLVVDKKIEVQKARLEDIVSSLRAAVDDLRKQESEQRGELFKSVEARIESLMGRVSGEMSEVRARGEELRGRLDSLAEKFGDFEDELKDDLLRVDRELQQGAAVAREIEEHIWELKKIPSNVLVTQFQGLDASLAADDDWGVKRVLARIKATIHAEYVSRGA